MLKSIIFLILAYNFFACKEAGKRIDEDLSMAKNDTFDFFWKEYDIPIADRFSADTIEYANKKTDYKETLMCPMLIGKEFNQVNQVLKEEIRKKAALVYADSADHSSVDTSKEVFGVRNENIPLIMYKDQNTVSYGFLSIFSEPHAMRPFRKYFSVNYNTARKTFIYFGDYFKIVRASDSVFVKSIIYGEIGNPDTGFYTLSDQVNFSFDKEYVYFYFDMFGETGTPMGTVKRVKKKYLLTFIRDEYK